MQISPLHAALVGIQITIDDIRYNKRNLFLYIMHLKVEAVPIIGNRFLFILGYLIVEI